MINSTFSTQFGHGEIATIACATRTPSNDSRRTLPFQRCAFFSPDAPQGQTNAQTPKEWHCTRLESAARPCYEDSMLPSFLKRLADPSIKNVLLCGCGGGFDFLHGLALMPELERLGKRVVVGSYSFGDPNKIQDAEIIWDFGDGAIVKRVTANSIPSNHYGPEVHLCGFLDAERPRSAPHAVYAYYARAFTVPKLTALYRDIVARHSIDAVIVIDGGSDSLMVGDEEGLGDPIEDAVSVATIAALERPSLKILVSIGLGADRFNHVSDAASLRAIAELTAAGGFLGAVGIEPTSPGFDFYKRGIEYVYANQTFRSALTGFILSAAEGYFGSDEIPPTLQTRVKPGGFFIWPLMAVIWAFDVEAVARRSLVAQWIRDCPTVRDCHLALYDGRANLGESRRPIENLPRHEDMRGS